ncbi:MAG TPA: hypothetical protein ENI52_05705, partial [Thermoplasmata archaeon]|nr:hypothetical protein [Thermoplasmata archaeon]
MSKKGMGLVIVAIIFAYGVAFTTTSLPYGKIIFVDDDFTNDPSNHKWNTIQAGIDDAEDGDIIYVFDGNYNESLFINKEIKIIGDGNVVVDGGWDDSVIGVIADNVSIENLKIENGQFGVFVNHNNFTMKNCEVHECENGLFLQSDNASIENCTFYSNIENSVNIIGRNVTFENCSFHSSTNAIVVEGKNISFRKCTVYECDWGIIAEYSSDIEIYNGSFYNIENKSIWIKYSNNISISYTAINDTFCGIWLMNVSNSSIIFSMFNLNKIGIKLQNSQINEIRDCNFIGNIGYGIYAENSFNNTIHHNNFIDNGINAYDNGINKWNTSIGNYWHDYNGIDENEDGIGDTPYEIGVNNDKKPLMNRIEHPPLFVWVSDEFTSSTPGWNVDHFDDIQNAVDAVAERGSIYVYWGSYDGVEI